MKKYFLFLVFLPLLFSCNQGKIDELSKQNTSLKKEAATKDSTINEFMETFNEIEENLALIKEKEDLISSTSLENEKGAGRTIVQDLKSINQLMAANREKLATLNEKVQSSGIRISEFKKMVNRLNQKLEERDREIANIKEEVAFLNATNDSLSYAVDTLGSKVSDLSMVNARQEGRIEEQIEALHTAYIAQGSFKELKEKGVVDKKGGIIGIGAVKKLKEDFNEEMFKKVDITELNAIPLSGKRATVITPHPSNSYKILGVEENDSDSLVITDPSTFWRASKYLVVVVD